MRRKTVSNKIGKVWVFGDYRNYFQNRVTLQLIAKGKELAKTLGTELSVVLLGGSPYQYAMEYVAHGADVIIMGVSRDLKEYHVETFTEVVCAWVRSYRPEIFIAGATSFGREFFPRLAKRLKTGLSADCVSLDIDPDTGLLVQTTPAWGGELLADVVTPFSRPQMATVHPGIFKERLHDETRIGRIVYPQIGHILQSGEKVIRTKPYQGREVDLENAKVVVAGGKGICSKENLDYLFELAGLLGGEVGVTRPVVLSGWAEEERLLGQTGKSVKPKLCISCGTSGALQFTTGIRGAETLIAINRDPNAPIFKIADLGLVGDATILLPFIVEKLKKRL